MQKTPNASFGLSMWSFVAVNFNMFNWNFIEPEFFVLKCHNYPVLILLSLTYSAISSNIHEYSIFKGEVSNQSFTYVWTNVIICWYGMQF